MKMSKKVEKAAVFTLPSGDARRFEIPEWLEPFDTEDDPNHGFLHRRLPGGRGLLLFTPEAKAAQDAGHIVLVVSRSKSGKTWVLRAAPPRGAGQPATGIENTTEIRLGSGPSLFRWTFEAKEHHEPVDEAPPYVATLGSGTFEEAVQRARAKAAGWGIPAVIYDPERRHSRRGFTSHEAAQEHAGFERWYESLS